MKVEQTIVKEDVKTKASELSEESDTKLPRYFRLIESSQNLIEIQTDLEAGIDVLFETACNKCMYDRGVLWANIVARVSKKGKVMITALNETEEENDAGNLSVVESSCITTVDEFNEKRGSIQTRASVDEKVSIGEEVTKEEKEKLLNLILEHQSSFNGITFYVFFAKVSTFKISKPFSAR